MWVAVFTWAAVATLAAGFGGTPVVSTYHRADGGFGGRPSGFGGGYGGHSGVHSWWKSLLALPRILSRFRYGTFGYAVVRSVATSVHASWVRAPDVGGFAGRPAYVGHPGYGYGYGRGGFGWHRPYWGGGYWHGGYWPRAYYGWGYPWFLGVLPAVYATYWWGGVPYYYANDVYYTWNSGYNGYVVTDPPPVDTGDSDSASSGDGSYASADPGDK